MIRPLRQRHRRMAFTLGICLPVAFVLGIALRKPAPSMASLPAGLVAVSPATSVLDWERTDLFAKSQVTVRLFHEPANSNHFTVEFSAPQDFVKPDLLVYWVAGNPNAADTLLTNAVLLGPLSSAVSLPIPSKVAANSGALLLFSLANSEILEQSRPLRFNEITQ